MDGPYKTNAKMHDAMHPPKKAIKLPTAMAPAFAGLFFHVVPPYRSCENACSNFSLSAAVSLRLVRRCSWSCRFSSAAPCELSAQHRQEENDRCCIESQDSAEGGSQQVARRQSGNGIEKGGRERDTA